MTTSHPPAASHRRSRTQAALVAMITLAALIAIAAPSQAGPPGSPDLLDAELANPDESFLELAISSDGRYVVYIDRPSAAAQSVVVARPLDGGPAVDLSASLPSVAGEVFYLFEITPDSQQVLVVRFSGNDEAASFFVVPIDGGPAVAVGGPAPTGRTLRDFALTPDGTRVVFAADYDTVGETALYSAPISGGARVTLADPVVLGHVEDGFAINSASTLVAFTGDVATDGVDELFVVPVDGSEAPVAVSGAITPLGDVEPGPQFLPDGSAILFTGDVATDGVDELFVVPVDGSSAPAAVSGSITPGGDVREFQVLPDSSGVVFRGDLRIDNTSELFVWRFARDDRRRLSRSLVDNGDVGEFVVAPDGSRVAYRADAEIVDREFVYSVPIIGGQDVRLTSESGEANTADPGDAVAFTPDSERVILVERNLATDRESLQSAPAGGGLFHELDRASSPDSSFFAPIVTPDSRRAVYFFFDVAPERLQVRIVDSAHRCSGRVATIVGTNGPDRLSGTPGDDVIVARGGADRISAGRGQDLVCAGAGNDTVRAGAGDDVVFGGGGADDLRGGPGQDQLIGQSGRDRLRGQGGDDRIVGGPGADTARGGAGNDVLRGNIGPDALLGQRGDDRIFGGPGRDRCAGGPGNDRVRQCER